MADLSFAVIGNPIEHSVSPLIHGYFAQQLGFSLLYEKIKGDEFGFEQQVLSFFKQGGCGLNVTLPFKPRAFALAAEPTLRCQLAGAANTLWMQENKLYADNTDGIGLVRDLSQIMELRGKRVLILGAGGAARGIIHPLLENQLSSLTLAARTLEKANRILSEFPQIKVVPFNELKGTFDLIINATSASLDGQALVLPEMIMNQQPFCYDLAYDLRQDTAFVQYALSCSCQAMDGLGMLVEQAAEAFYIWHGVRPKTESILQQLRLIS